MESSGLPGSTSDHPSHRWARLMGAAIAVVTLILPFLVVAYYSSSSSVDSLPRNIYSLPEADQ